MLRRDKEQEHTGDVFTLLGRQMRDMLADLKCDAQSGIKLMKRFISKDTKIMGSLGPWRSVWPK